MNTADPSRKLALIAGPTASGKSALAVELAGLVPSVVINADSAQVYRDLHVLTARPSENDMQDVPHALFGHIDGATACSAAAWARDAKVAIVEARTTGRLPIVTGGTGLYIRTLLDGIAPVPAIDPAIRAAVRAIPVAEAHAALAGEDPAAAARLAPADTTRVARALEVVRSTGRTLAEWQTKKQGGIADEIDLVPLILIPPRALLAERIVSRFETMIERGAIEEVEALLARRLDTALPVMRAIGVREIAAYLRGEIDRSEMLECGGLATRQYAKRQSTWFANQSPPEWRPIREFPNARILRELLD